MKNVTPGREHETDGNDARSGHSARRDPTTHDPRLRRLRGLAWLLDRSIPLPGGWRIGLDPLLGSLPGAGDWLGGVLSTYLLYEGARLGLPPRVLGRMVLNIAIEVLVGAVPVVGDLFDFAWQANVRNLQLVERHYRPTLRPRPLGPLVAGLLALVFLFITAAGVLAFLIARWVWTALAA
ncbi:MAG TPA: DUF4112 domain-containing protein [Opitutaceae bacterium]